jgi:hypothetical protein
MVFEVVRAAVGKYGRIYLDGERSNQVDANIYNYNKHWSWVL